MPTRGEHVRIGYSECVAHQVLLASELIVDPVKTLREIFTRSLLNSSGEVGQAYLFVCSTHCSSRSTPWLCRSCVATAHMRSGPGPPPKNRVASGRLVVEQILCEIEGHYLGKSCWKIPRHSSIRDQKTRRIPKMKKPLPVMMVTSARHVGRYAVGGLVGGMGHIQSRLHSRQ